MNNLDIIKHYFLPLLHVEDENEKIIIHDIFKSKLISSLLNLNWALENKKGDFKKYEHSISNLSLEQSVDRYAELINAWNPEKTLNMFWIKGINVYRNNKSYEYHSYSTLKQFYKKYETSLFNALNQSINNSSMDIERQLYKELLLSLAMYQDLTEEHYKQYENECIGFYKDEKPSIADFKKFFKAGELYNSSVIWANYLDFFCKDQAFVNSVKKYFTEQEVDYVFKEEKIDVFLQNQCTKTFCINPNFVAKHNENITKQSIDKIIEAIYECYYNMAEQIENNINSNLSYNNTNYMSIIIYFNNYKSVALYEKSFQKFNEYLENIISSIIVEENKTIIDYVKEIEHLYKYYTKKEDYYFMESQYPIKNIEKRLKI